MTKDLSVFSVLSVVKIFHHRDHREHRDDDPKGVDDFQLSPQPVVAAHSRDHETPPHLARIPA
jgi:hypothetical protein